MTTTRLARFLNQYFYFSMSLLIAVVVVYGFGQTIDQNLIHATPIRPWLLYVHATVFSGWVVFFILQSGLVRMRKVQVHRTLGWFGVAMGCLIPVLGISTAITMARFKVSHFHSPTAATDMAVSFFDIVCFTIAFALAVYWRKKPEFHRRLMLVASCALTAAAFGRFPNHAFSYNWFYSGVDVLVFLGVVRDLIVMKRVHPVYLYALPALIVGQSFVMYLVDAVPAWWLKIANAMVG
jgi:hypothetical protein